MGVRDAVDSQRSGHHRQYWGLCLENSGCHSVGGEKDTSGSEEQKAVGRPGSFILCMKWNFPFQKT